MVVRWNVVGEGEYGRWGGYGNWGGKWYRWRGYGRLSAKFKESLHYSGLTNVFTTNIHWSEVLLTFSQQGWLIFLWQLTLIPPSLFYLYWVIGWEQPELAKKGEGGGQSEKESFAVRSRKIYIPSSKKDLNNLLKRMSRDLFGQWTIFQKNSSDISDCLPIRTVLKCKYSNVRLVFFR